MVTAVINAEHITLWGSLSGFYDELTIFCNERKKLSCWKTPVTN